MLGREDEEQGRDGGGSQRGSGFDNNGNETGVYGKKTRRWRWWLWQGQSSIGKDGVGCLLLVVCPGAELEILVWGAELHIYIYIHYAPTY